MIVSALGEATVSLQAIAAAELPSRIDLPCSIVSGLRGPHLEVRTYRDIGARDQVKAALQSAGVSFAEWRQSLLIPFDRFESRADLWTQIRCREGSPGYGVAIYQMP